MERDIKVSDYYIAYFDILGYKELIDTLNENIFLQVIDSVIQETLVTANSKICFPSEILQMEYRIFSDNILLCYHIPEFNTTYDYLDFPKLPGHSNQIYELLYLGLLMEQVVQLQRDFICKYNILVRGAITSGTLYFDKNYVYGKGLIDVYRLENNIAIFPRIIISSKILDILLKYKNNQLKQNRIPHLNMVVDNNIFLDYLYEQDNYFIKLHGDMIKDGLIRYSCNKKVLEKYEWCKTYHNSFCCNGKNSRFLI